MIAESKERIRSRELAIRLYDRWIRERRRRAGFAIPQSKEELDKVRVRNFVTQLAEPRRRHLEELKEVGDEVSTADKVALLVMMELPVLEVSTLLHRLSIQMADDPNATYFNAENMADNCGCGCGCGCAFALELPWEEQIRIQREAKPFSIDSFNEIGLAEKERDALLARDFLASYEVLSKSVDEGVNSRYFAMGQGFA